MTSVRLGVFTPSVILDAARRLGRFEDLGIDVSEHLVTSSPAQFRALVAGELDLVVTSPDNVLLYAGFDDNPLGGRLPLTITAALDRGLGLSLWLRPGLTEDEARDRGLTPRGLTLGVDVPFSGFALAATALMARHQLTADEVLSLGSTPRRREALVDGVCDVTILGAGNELRAAEQGCFRVAGIDELGDYLGAVLCRVRQDAPSPVAVAGAADTVARMLVEVGAEIVAGSHADAVIDAAQRLLELSHPSATQHLEILRSSSTGIVADGRLTRPPLETLTRLRMEGQDAAGQGVAAAAPGLTAESLSPVVDQLLAEASAAAR